MTPRGCRRPTTVWSSPPISSTLSTHGKPSTFRSPKKLSLTLPASLFFQPDQGRKGPAQVRQAAAAPVRAAGRKEPHGRVGVRRRGAGIDGQQRHHAVHHEPAGRALERELQLISGWFFFLRLVCGSGGFRIGFFLVVRCGNGIA